MFKILVVEDNEMNRDILTRRLKRRGYDISTAIDGIEGISKVKSESPDLVLMDIQLPLMNGLDATRMLKASPDTQDIPIIALTAYPDFAEKRQSLQAGCDDYDLKPIEMNRLLRKIEALLDKKNPGEN